MKLSDQLEQKKAAAVKQMRSILDTAKAGEGRSLSDDENSKLTDLRTQIEGYETQIQNERFLEEQEREAATAEAERREKQRKIDKAAKPSGEQRDRKKVISEYRFINAIRAQLPHGKLEGLTKEMHEEAVNEARQSGTNVSGIAVPSFFLDATEKRDLVVGTATAGGNTVATDLDGFIGPLRPRLRVRELGATVLSNLVGNLDIPRQNATTSATWEGETDANAESEPTFNKVSLTPKRLGAFTEVGKQLIAQSSLGIEQLVRNDLQVAIQTALDLAAINGSGSAPEPRGILNTSGIGDVAIGTNGGAPTRDHLVSLVKEIMIDNADMGDLAFLSNPDVMAKLMTTKVDAGSGQFVMPEGGSSLIGYRAAFSTQVPNALDKGSETGTLSAIIFGYWRDLLIGQWAGVDLVVDPYTKSKNAVVSLVVNSWWDVAVRHAESFAAIKDADPAIA